MEEKRSTEVMDRYDSATEELRSMIYRQGTFESFYDTPLEVNWPITDMCNYHCSYCFGQSPINKERFSNLSQIKNAVENISKMNRSRIMVTLVGGEPTIHPYFLDLIDLLRTKLGCRLKGILIISNGSRNCELYEKAIEIAEDVNVKMELSIHTEYTNIDHIKELVERLSSKCDLEFPLMFNPEKREMVYEMYDVFLGMRKHYPFHVIVQTLRQPPNFDELDYRYTEEDYKWQRESQRQFDIVSKESVKNVCREKWDSGFPKTFFWDVQDKKKRQIVTDLDRNEAFQVGLLRFKDMYCVQGSSVLSILPDGTCRKSHCAVDIGKFNIFDDISSEEMNRAFILKCPYENCGCGTNHPIPKFLEYEEAMNFVKSHLQ